MDQRTRILPPYTRRVNDLTHSMWRFFWVAALVFIGTIMGFAFAILPTGLVLAPMMPVFVLAGLVLWIAPDLGTNLDRPIRRLWYVFLTVSLVWPAYVSITIPGIGWASFARIFIILTAVLALWALSTSKRMRAEMLDVMRVNRLLWFAFLGFVALQFLITIATGTFSGRWLHANIVCYFMLFLTAWIFRNEGSGSTFVRIMLVGAAIAGFYGAWEYHYTIPLWANHIPSFMKVDPSLLEKVLAPKAGRGVEAVRVSSIYLTALTYAEYIALVLPFAFWALCLGKRLWGRVLAVPLIALILSNAVMTDARSAMVGTVIALLGTAGLLSLRRYVRSRQNRDIIGPSLFWGYPAVAVATFFMILAHPRLRVKVLGGGQHEASNWARDVQWETAFQRLAQNPFGYGDNQTGNIVNFSNRAGVVTTDSYFINLLIDFGVLGFILYAVIFLTGIYIAIRTFILSDDSEENLAMPVAISLTSFAVIKYVLSQQENHYLAFSILGLAIALAWRQQKRLSVSKHVEAARPVNAPRPRLRPHFAKLAG